MIEADFTLGEGVYDLSIKGHAGYSDQGNDIVCAGVSAIAFTLLGFLEGYRDEWDELGAQPKSGDFTLHCKGGEKADIAFDMALTGLMQIAAAYPKHVSVTIHSAPGGDSRERP